MSYREENGQVILAMSREDFGSLCFWLGIAAGHMMAKGEKIDRIGALLNRLNEGNPNYRPYQVEAKT